MNRSIKRCFLAVLMAFSCFFNIDIQASDSNTKRGIFAFFAMVLTSGYLLKVNNSDSGKKESKQGWFQCFTFQKKHSDVERIPVLDQQGLTCGQHAIKNAELGVLYGMTNEENFKQIMLSSDYFNRRFPVAYQNIPCDERLLSDEMLKNALQVQYIESVEKNICVVDNWEVFHRMHSERELRSMVQLSQADCVVGFVVNTSGTSTPLENVNTMKSCSHWNTYVVKKEDGKVKRILFFDSLSNWSMPNSRTLDKIKELACKKTSDVQTQIYFKNIDFHYEKFEGPLHNTPTLFEKMNYSEKEKHIKYLAQFVNEREFNVILPSGEIIKKVLSGYEKINLLKKIEQKGIFSEPEYEQFEKHIHQSLSYLNLASRNLASKKLASKKLASQKKLADDCLEVLLRPEEYLKKVYLRRFESGNEQS